MFKATGSRVPRFRQIMVYGDTVMALAADAGGDTGSVWVYIPKDAGLGDEGWVKLSRNEVEDVEA